MKFSKAFLREELELPWNADIDNIVGRSRWSLTREIIFQHDGKFYRTTYQQGATENQEYEPWDYLDEVDCEEVQQVEKVVKVWEPVVGA